MLLVKCFFLYPAGRQEDASLEQYVTGKTLDGLFVVIGEQERQLRQNPAAAGSAILKKVFGVLK